MALALSNYPSDWHYKCNLSVQIVTPTKERTMKTRTIATTMLTVAILTISAGIAQARVIVRPRVVVVKPKIVVVKPAPVQKAKVWVPGHFVKKPYHRKVWVPGHWKKI